MEILDPLKIPPTPVQKANLSMDFLKLSTWLLHSLVEYLNTHEPGWKTHPIQSHFVMPMKSWKAAHGAQFPQFKTHVWSMFEFWDLEFGITNLGDPRNAGGYDDRRKVIVLNSAGLVRMLAERKAVAVLSHELRHAYDDLISKGQGMGSGSAHVQDYREYLALPSEVRARFTEMEPELIQELYFADGGVKDVSYFKVMIPQLLKDYELSPRDLSRHAQPIKLYQKLISRAYTLKQSMDKLSQAERAQIIAQIQSVGQAGQPTATKLNWWQRIKQKFALT